MRAIRKRTLGIDGQAPGAPDSQIDPHHVAGLYMPGLRPSTRFGSGNGRSAEELVQRLNKEVLAPHHTLVDPKVFALVVAAVLEDSFPGWCVDRQEVRGQKRVQDPTRVIGVPRRPLRI